MKRLIEFLLTGCWHHWDIIQTKQLNWSNGFGDGTCTRFILQCKKCGNLKKYDAK